MLSYGYDPREWKPPPVAMARRIPSLIFLMVLGVLLISSSTVEARSPHPPPLRRLAHPTVSSLEILPRKNPHLNPRYISQLPPHPSSLRHSDSLVISLSLPDLLPFPASFLLKPSKNIFHPDARISYDSGVSGNRYESLKEEDWKLYTGDVIHPRWIERIKALEDSGRRNAREDAAAVLGRASIMVHETGEQGDGAVFEGTFTMYGATYNVMTREKYQRVKTAQDIEVESLGARMVVFRDSDMTHHPNRTSSHHSDNNDNNAMFGQSCSHDKLSYNSEAINPIFKLPEPSSLFPYIPSIFRRDDTGGMTVSSNFIDSINQTSGCPNTQQIVYMGVALDCNYVATYGSTDAARTQVLNDWNQISALYKSTFNISLGIIELQVRNATCPSTAVDGESWNVGCSQNLTLDERLSLFSQWRGDKGDDGAGLWHLMSACPTDSEVGVAWLGTLCQTTASQQSGQTVSGTGISTATKTEWSLVAHEIGHGFGAIHDCSSGCSLSGSCCPYTTSSCDAGGQFIMNPTTSSSEQSFSGCTLGNICTNIGNRAVNTQCIQSPGSRTVISLQQCGNGIVEDGEDCDPGGNSTSACCDASTCKFRDGALCDPSNSACCTESCQLASAGTVCRSAVDATCDYEETCTGNNATCPEDKTAPDGQSCGSDGLACASGTCTSLNQQCTLAGSSMGLTQACGQKDDKSCVVTCRDPNVTNQCVVLQTPLVDGSPCGYGGHCYNSTCKAGSWQATAAAWYRSNLQISIPVTIVVGLLVLALLWAIVKCLVAPCCGRNRKRPPPPTQSSSGNRLTRGRNSSAYVPAPAPPPGFGGEPNMSQLPPPPLSVQRNTMTDSMGSTEPLMRNDNGYPAQSGYGPEFGSGQGGGYGQSQPYGGYGGPYAQGGGGGGQNQGWVDASAYNGPHYGRQEAYGR
ncbi:zinc metalloprotease [Kwoniella heveanensis BCC8398]|uniref:Disintegrin and metalloproteinase domain-containing protein B n=1 Tax=Kwoniella heveanensis BCC8398 TaxID=1296120 RepID=A0A1B9GLS7_9TREE|nr:zinc metalloprotease [Kwoniella heveanensis BCC8398]